MMKTRVLVLALWAAGTLAANARAQEDFRILGSRDAPVEMTLYSDFECPFCRTFALAVFPALEAEFIDGGLLRLRFVFFPLSTIHPNAVGSARAAYCAGAAGRFWAFHDYLFVRQPEWRGDAVPDSLWIAYARNLGIHSDSFSRCLQDAATVAAVQADWAEAISAGVPGTPTIALNGESVPDFGSYEELRALVQRAIASATDRGAAGDASADSRER